MVDKLDDADVLMISSKGSYGYIKIQGSCEVGIEVCYLAICKYPKSDKVYLFLCDEHMSVENDWDYDSIEVAIEAAQKRTQTPILWRYSNTI